MDSAQPWVSSSSRSPTNLDYRQIFDAYLYEYLLKRNLLTSAEIFKQEAQIEDIRSLLSASPGDFLFDWWAIFYDSHTTRQNGLQGNHAPFFSQFGQSSSTYGLAPFPPFLRDPEPMPQADGTDYSSQVWPTPDGSPLICRTSGIPQIWCAPNGSPLVTSAGDIPFSQWALGGAVVTATEEAPLPYGPYLDTNLSSQSRALTTAVVLTPRNLTSLSSTQFPQLGIRRGSSPNDLIDVEAPMTSSASVPSGTSSAFRGCRRRRQSQPQSRGSSVMGANQMHVPSYIPLPGYTSRSQARMVSQMANYSRPSPFPDIGAQSIVSLVANFNAANGFLVPSSLGVGGQVETCGLFLSKSQAMFASTSNQNSNTLNAANDQTSKTLITETMELSAAGSSSTQETAFEKSSYAYDAETETVRQLSVPAISSNPRPDPEMENNEEVSSAMKDSYMGDTDEVGEQHKENDKVVGANLNENNGVEDEGDIATVAPASQSRLEASQMPSQPQPSQLIEFRDEEFEFKQEACLESNLAELWCCHFSSSGKYLACAGIDRKVIVWNMGTFFCTVSEEHHDDAIVDIRFKINSSIFASASLDTTIRIWDASKPEKALIHLTGHAANIISLDFHPKNFDLLCSSDSNQEIRFWNISNATCLHAIKGAVQVQQVRFQTQKGKYLAAVAGNTINIFDSETLTIMHTLKGHIQPVECVCWDSSGRYLASASQESVHIWSVSNWCNSTHKLTAESGSIFKSCIFHPGISLVVIIGSGKNIEIWNPMGNGKTLVIPAHESCVAGLASSICTDIIGSASYDGLVKLWK